MDKITAGLVLAQIKAVRPAGVTDAATDRESSPPRIPPTLELAQVASTLEKGIKNGLGDGLMRETMPLQTIS